MNLSCTPEFLISNRASVASEKILEKIRGKSYSPMEMECNNHSYVRLQSSMCTTKKYRKKTQSVAVGLFHDWA